MGRYLTQWQESSTTTTAPRLSASAEVARTDARRSFTRESRVLPSRKRMILGDRPWARATRSGEIEVKCEKDPRLSDRLRKDPAVWGPLDTSLSGITGFEPS
jgi:hypothetical protein